MDSRMYWVVAVHEDLVGCIIRETQLHARVFGRAVYFGQDLSGEDGWVDTDTA